MTTQPSLPLGLYRHYKGKMYLVLGVARHSETEQWLVVYQPQYGDQMWWVRPFEQFSNSVIVEGRQVQRFQWVESSQTEQTRDVDDI